MKVSPSTEEAKSFAMMREKIQTQRDKEWTEQGATQEELEISRRLSDLFACGLAAGRTPAEIEAVWEGKTSEEMLNAAEGTK